ncbi:hypothetical protein E1263_19715 [Kribbella antibiotica]|uniref:DUF2510 domain-containing protein n=1 Tax=Kribbella antibiotica TaxID=190195 RepID=A0A4R4ZJM7_9ACTN|nr:hypothetical protein [Kribbella antibiotica]TDD58350.1 hypothetical protein E1263_19715 [Kribbella antibiotica]
MPTYSDDGQWWWDGRSWQPVTQQPPQQQYAAAPQPQQQYPYPQQQGPGQAPYQPQGFYQPPKKSRGPLIVAGAVALVLVIAVGGVVVWKNTGSDDSSGGGTTAGAPPKDAKVIEPGQPVTEQALSEVNAQAFHESVMKRQMTTPIGRLKTAVFENAQEFTGRSSFYVITDMAVDRKSGAYYYAKSALDGPNDDDPGNNLCMGAEEWRWSSFSKAWGPTRSAGMDCKRIPFQGGSDAIVSTGLNAEQADKVVAYFRSNKGFVNAAQPTLLTAGGKTYVRQVVDFKPMVLSDDNYWGSALLMWGLREVGINPADWRWSNPFNLSEGIHMVYYLDTASLLPVGAFQSGIDTPAQHGEPATKRETVQVVNYSYPAALPKPTVPKGPGTLTISLPEGWKVP